MSGSRQPSLTESASLALDSMLHQTLDTTSQQTQERLSTISLMVSGVQWWRLIA